MIQKYASKYKDKNPKNDDNCNEKPKKWFQKKVGKCFINSEAWLKTKESLFHIKKFSI